MPPQPWMTPIHFLAYACLFLFSVNKFPLRCVAQPISNIQLRDLNSPSPCSEPRVAADPDQPLGMVFASCRHGIVAINGTQVWTIVPSTVPGCPTPQGLAVHAGVHYATCFVTGRSDPNTPTVVRVNFTNNEWIVSTAVTFKDCASPMELEIDHFSGRVYILCWRSLIVLDGIRIAPLVPYDVCHFPTAVSAAASSHGGDVFVGCSTDKKMNQPSRVLAVNPTTGNFTVLVDFDAQCQNPRGIIPHLTFGALYVVCSGNAQKNKGSVVSVHGTTVSTLLSGDVCFKPRAATFDPVSGFVFCNCDIHKTVAFHPAAPASTLTTLVDSNRCENSQSMIVVPHPSTPPHIYLLLGCRNSDLVLLVTATVSIQASDIIIPSVDDTEFFSRV